MKTKTKTKTAKQIAAEVAMLKKAQTQWVLPQGTGERAACERLEREGFLAGDLRPTEVRYLPDGRKEMTCKRQYRLSESGQIRVMEMV